MAGLCIKTGMTAETFTAKEVVGGGTDTLFLSGQMTVADFEAQVPPTVTAILSFGLCGGLSPGLPVGGVCIAAELLGDGGTALYPDRDWTRRLSDYAGVQPMRYYSTGQWDLADTPEQRAALFNQLYVCAIDDESGPMAQFATKRGIPFAVMRVVFDDWQDTVPLSARHAVNPDGSSNLGSIIQWLKDHPQQVGQEIKNLIKTAADYNTSLQILLQVGNRVGPWLQWL